jgi:phytoene synthase
VLLAEAAAAMRRFPVPMSLWRNFFGAMHLDIDQARFATYRDFLHYAEGATVAPTTIYLYLIAARSQPAEPAGVYHLPAGFDLLGCGRQLGHFAYLAHILRDLAFDLSTGDEGLLYLARDDMERHGVDEERLFRDLQRQRVSEPVRALVGELIARARQAAAEGRRLAVPLAPHLTPDCAFILELIISMYERVLGKIVDCDGDPLRGEHHLSMAEKGALVQAVARRVGVPAPELPGVPAQ